MNRTYLKAIVYSAVVVLLAGLLYSCLVLSRRIPTSTKFISTTLVPESASESSMNEGDLATLTACGDYAACATPNNLLGKVYYAGIMVGTGDSGYSVGPIIGEVIDPSSATSLSVDDLLNFSMADKISAGGSIECCEGATYPPDDEAYVVSFEFLFGYLNTSVTLTDADLEPPIWGNHRIQTVFADIDGTELKKGDLRYMVAGGAWNWCTAEEGCTHATRPENPIQYEEIADFSGTPDGKGNQTIPSFTARLTAGSAPVQLTESDLLSNSWNFTLDFDTTNGVAFTMDPSTMTEIAELMRAFRLYAAPGNEEEGFSVVLTAEGTPITTTTTTPGDDGITTSSTTTPGDDGITTSSTTTPGDDGITTSSTTSTISTFGVCTTDADCDQWELDVISVVNINQAICASFANGSYCTMICSYPSAPEMDCSQIETAYGMADGVVECANASGGGTNTSCTESETCYCSQQGWYE